MSSFNRKHQKYEIRYIKEVFLDDETIEFINTY